MPEEILCSFCEGTNEEKPFVVTDGKNSICSDCVKLCRDIIKEDSTPNLKAVKERKNPVHSQLCHYRNVFKVDFTK